MKKLLSISILGIGTELTTGQILNKNAQWISQKMRALGADCTMHLVVPDERALILSALQTCAHHSDILFITGGLGPTSDDFTRDVIAQWTGLEMLWDEYSWQHLNERLQSRAIPVKEMQKQQCYFPKGSQVLINRMGTANGFSLEFQAKKIFVLPGPPREIEAIWEDWIAGPMADLCRDIDSVITRSWDTIGFGESQVAEVVDEVLRGCEYERGYRVHLPFVEFKLTYRASQSVEAATWVEKLDQALSSMTLLRDGEDAANLLMQKLNSFQSLLIADGSDGSYLLKRLFPLSREVLSESQVFFSNNDRLIGQTELELKLMCEMDRKAVASFSYMGIEEQEIMYSPYKAQLQKERSHQYFAEMAMIFFLKNLEKLRIVSA